jgi:hypothetical protein
MILDLLVVVLAVSAVSLLVANHVVRRRDVLWQVRKNNREGRQAFHSEPFMYRRRFPISFRSRARSSSATSGDSTSQTINDLGSRSSGDARNFDRPRAAAIAILRSLNSYRS